MNLTLEQLGFSLTSKEFSKGSRFTKGHVVTLPMVLKNSEVLRIAVLENEDGLCLTECGALDRLGRFFRLTNPDFSKWRKEMAKKQFCELKSSLRLQFLLLRD